MLRNVEDVSTVKKKLYIEIPEDEVVHELNVAYQNLKKNAKIKGFRPGKAPRSVLERLYKKDIHADVSSKLIQESFENAIKELDLKILSIPKIEPPELDEKKPYKYEALVEINPEIEDIDFTGLELKRTLYQANDEEIDTQLKMLQKNLTLNESIEEDRAVIEGDLVLIDFEGFKDGKPFEETQKTENFTLKIGSGQILKDFEEKLIGIKPGDTKEIIIKFPEDYFNKNLVNLEITFQVTLNEIRKEVIPEIDDELAKKVGQYETLDELKDAIKDNLKEGYDKRTEQELNEQIFKALLTRNDFEVPDVLIESELDAIVEEMERSFKNHNKSLEEAGYTRETLSERYRDVAEKQVKRYMLLRKLVKQEDLAISDEEVEEGFNEMASTFNSPVEEIKTYYEQNKDKIELFKDTLLEKKAMKLIIDNSIVEDVEPDKSQES